MDIDKKAIERVMKARAALILARRFYGVLVSHVEPVISRRFPTAATNGKIHFFNPDFVETLTQAELEFAQAHETEHDARHHGTRRGERDPKKWNEACDYAINPDLVDEGFKAPSWVLLDRRFKGMSAEDIYRTRELEEQQQKQQQQSESPEADADENEQKPDEANSDPGHDEPENDENETGDNTDDGDESDEQGNDGEGDSQSENDEESQNDAGDGDGKNDESSDEQEGESNGDSDGESSEQEGKSSGSAPSDQEGGDGEAQTSCGDPGRCGEVLDSAHDASENSELDQQWERTVRQAASMAKAIGQCPGHVTAEIERANNPPRDWRDELRDWVDNGARRIETWNRPNRRVISQGLILPSSQRDGVNKIACVIDTSGSMDDIALGCIRTELQAMLDEHAIDELVAIYCDTRVTRTDHFVQGDELIFDPRGRGGTDLQPAFKHVADEVGDVSGMLVFTDLYIGEPGPEPDCNVLFAVYGYPQQVRELIKNSPWNAPAIDVGVH